ncbi:MAG: extracellular solute-binding protein [Anaerolineae bacterium]|nr:extracellular solute-binding protein [Anaerolineae bacterium]
MFWSKLQSILFCLVLLALLLAGCAEDSDKPDQSAVADQTAVAPTVTPDVLVIWHTYTGPEQAALEQIRTDFEVAHPDIDVQVNYVEAATFQDEYRNAVLGGAGPDLIFAPSEWLSLFAAEGIIVSFDNVLLEQLHDVMPEPVAQAALVDDTPYGIAFSADFTTLYYNRTLLPKQPETFSELIFFAEKAGLTIPPTFRATSGFYLFYDTQLMDSSGASLLRPSKVELYLATVKAFAEYPGIVFSSDRQVFLQGQSSMLVASSADYAALRDGLGDSLGVARLPERDGQVVPSLITVRVVMQSLNITQAARENAVLFLTFLLSPGTQNLWFEQTYRAPVAMFEVSDETVRVEWDYSLRNGVPSPLHPDFAGVMLPVLDQAVEAVTLEGADPVIATESVMAGILLGE